MKYFYVLSLSYKLKYNKMEHIKVLPFFLYALGNFKFDKKKLI